MRYVQLNKGWKIFGGIVVTLLAILGIYCACCGLAEAFGHLTFAENFTTFFGCVKEAVETVPPEEVVEGAKILLMK